MTEDAELTDAERLEDLRKENDALRTAIADAWQWHGRCQQSLADTKDRLAGALADAAYWREVATGL